MQQQGNSYFTSKDWFAAFMSTGAIMVYTCTFFIYNSCLAL